MCVWPYNIEMMVRVAKRQTNAAMQTGEEKQGKVKDH